MRHQRWTVYRIVCFFVAALMQPLHALDAHSKTTYTIAFDAFLKVYDTVQASENSPVDIVYTNFRDDMDLVKAAAQALARRIPSGTELIVILGDKANGLGVLVATQANLPWIILTNKPTPEGVCKHVSYSSITSGHKTMFMSKTLCEKIRNKKIILLDDVISSGGTMKAALDLVKESGAYIQGIFCAFTENIQRQNLKGYSITSLGHLPIFKRT